MAIQIQNKKSIILIIVICFINNNIIRCDVLDNICPRIMHQVFDGYVPTGNNKAGNYTEHRNETTLWPCVAECCRLKTECNLAFIWNDTCYHVKCASNELCIPVKRTNLTSNLQLLLVNPVTEGEAWIDILKRVHFSDFPLLQKQQQLEKSVSIYNKNNEKYEQSQFSDSLYNLPRSYDLGRKPNLNDLYGYEHFNSNDNEYINDEGDMQGEESKYAEPKYFTQCELGIEGMCPAFEECRLVMPPPSRRGVCNCKANYVRLDNGNCVSKYKNSPIDAIAQKLLSKQIQNFNGEGDVESSPKASIPADPVSSANAIKPLTVSVVSKDVRLPENEVSLSAFVMPDENTSGDKYTYLWTLIEQPTGAVNGTMTDQTKDKVKLSSLSSGLYRFKVSVTGKTSYGEASANVTVLEKNRINKAPVVNITPKEQTVKLPNSKAILDGSASSDDEKIISWLWELVQGPIGYQPTLPETSTLQLEDLTLAGNYTFKLTVKDADQVANSTTATIQVLKEIDYPPEANAGTDVILYLPHNSITLNGSLSKDDHEIVEWEWTWSKDSSDQSKAVDMQKTRTPYLELSNLETGIYTFVLKVTDAKGQTSSSTVHVFVKPPTNLPPVAKAGNNITITLPKNWIVLNGSDSTDDIKITNFYWKQISGPNTAQLLNANTTISNATQLTVGEYIFELFVIDETNNNSTDRIKVTVIQEKNASPIANAGGDQTLTLPLSAIILNGTKSSDDLGITNYSWVRESSSLAVGTIIGNSDHEAILMLTSVVPGRYQFKLTVLDAQGVSASDSCSIIVHPDPYMMNMIELTLTMEAIVLTQSELESLQQKLELLLGNNVKLHMRDLKIEQKTDRIILVFYVEKMNTKTGNLEVMSALDAERTLKEKFWRDYTILGASISGIRTAICQNNCSDHGQCNHETRACMCETFWMPDIFYFWGVADANCDWSILYVIIGVFVVFLLLSAICWGITCVCRRKVSIIKHSNRVSSRKKPQKYALLETNDAEDLSTAFSRASITDSETDSDVLFESRASKPLNGILRNSTNNNTNDRNGLKYSTTRLGRRIKT